MPVHPDLTAHRAVDACGGTSDTLESIDWNRGYDKALEDACKAVKKPDALMAELLAALKVAKGNMEHMGAWISAQEARYSFESFGEDMPGINAAITKAEGTEQ